MHAPPTIAAALLAAGCGVPAVDGGAVDPAERAAVGEVAGAVRPEPLLELVDELRELVAGAGDCPVLVEEGADYAAFAGDCALPDGAWVEGELEVGQDGDALWVAGDGFALRGPREAELDGAIELHEQEGVLLVDVAASWCAGAGCSAGAVAADLAYTLYPADGVPEEVEVVVSGAVRTSAGLARVEGTWRTDRAACADEPLDGTLSVTLERRHVLGPDGARECDGCVAWAVQGVPVEDGCGLGL